MNKLEAFWIFLMQKPIIVISIIIHILLISFVVKVSLEPLGVPVIDEALKEVPWWVTNLSLIIIVMKSANLLYLKFEKWCEIQGF